MVSVAAAQSDSAAAEDCTPIPRRLPPRGLEIPPAQIQAWQTRLMELNRRREQLQGDNLADVDVLLKACRYAWEIGELYQDKDFAKVDRLLELASKRIGELEQGESTWATDSGRVVRGFVSQVDGSPQPLGLVLPEDWSLADKPLPLYVWLHGRGDKNTDLHFLCERLDKDGQITPPGAIVVHPFGRQCVGYKSAGETDVLEAIEFVCENYPVDRQRIVLMGFSMGGAGVWHIAAHYSDRFVAASPGAGFAETAQYQRLKPADYPPGYEQVLWGIYDVPDYTRNLFNLPVVAYSGENDKQIQAARVMEQAFARESRDLTHLIGPGMGHKYHPDTLAEILRRMDAAVESGQPLSPDRLFIQTKHPRYGRQRWLQIDGMLQPYQRATLSAYRNSGQWNLQTINVSRFEIAADHPGRPSGRVLVDGDVIEVPPTGKVLVALQDQLWQVVESFPEVRKQPGLSGPIDDAFLDPFLVVLPTGNATPAVDQWVRCESQNLVQRWRDLFRGDIRVCRDDEVTEQDMQQYHLVLWGTPESNSVMKKVFVEGQSNEWPFQSDADQIGVGEVKTDASQNVLLGIHPNPLSPDRYVVFNSGPTFRQAHDRTNSLQNPKLPDWCILSLDTPPSAEAAGRVVRAGFFDDAWQPLQELSW